MNPRPMKFRNSELDTAETKLVSASQDTVVLIELTTSYKDQAHLAVSGGDDHFGIINPIGERRSRSTEKSNSAFQLG